MNPRQHLQLIFVLLGSLIVGLDAKNTTEKDKPEKTAPLTNKKPRPRKKKVLAKLDNLENGGEIEFYELSDGAIVGKYAVPEGTTEEGGSRGLRGLRQNDTPERNGDVPPVMLYELLSRGRETPPKELIEAQARMEIERVKHTTGDDETNVLPPSSAPPEASDEWEYDDEESEEENEAEGEPEGGGPGKEKNEPENGNHNRLRNRDLGIYHSYHGNTGYLSRNNFRARYCQLYEDWPGVYDEMHNCFYDYGWNYYNIYFGYELQSLVHSNSGWQLSMLYEWNGYEWEFIDQMRVNSGYTVSMLVWSGWKHWYLASIRYAGNSDDHYHWRLLDPYLY